MKAPSKYPDKVRALMLGSGMNDLQLADLIGVPPSTIYRWVSKSPTRPRMKQQEALAKAFGLPSDWYDIMSVADLERPARKMSRMVRTELRMTTAQLEIAKQLTGADDARDVAGRIVAFLEEEHSCKGRVIEQLAKKWTPARAARITEVLKDVDQPLLLDAILSAIPDYIESLTKGRRRGGEIGALTIRARGDDR